ncbi:MAG TPA: hypothetical protein VL282_07440 [Tepidisphaeraceae bacterium]|jgi:hypothetical protein|nr:hypothetical protein [Tepidisphaeraceae bacterium]
MLVFLPSVVLFLVAVGLGALLAMLVRSLLTAMIFAIVSIAILQWIVASLPFCGLVSEVAIFLIAPIFGAPAFTPLWMLQKRFEKREVSSVTMREALPIVLIIPILFPLIGPGLLMTVGERWRYASDIDWTCDGRVVEKYHSWNHQAPTLVARSEGGERWKLEGVDQKFFATASVGDALKKDAGHTHAMLNGVSLEIVRPRIAIFGIPQAMAPD